MTSHPIHPLAVTGLADIADIVADLVMTSLVRHEDVHGRLRAGRCGERAHCDPNPIPHDRVPQQRRAAN
jgi:hypothetical protein